MANIDEQSKKILENYSEAVAYDKRHRENILSIHEGKTVSIYETDPKVNKKRLLFGESFIGRYFAKTLNITSNVFTMSIHLLASLVFALATVVLVLGVVILAIPVSFHIPVIIATVVYVLIAVLRA